MPKGKPTSGAAMTPHRRRILEILAHGPIVDESGRAVSRLMEQTGHKTTNALSGVLESMEAAGQIRREVAGRRTYRIEAATPMLDAVSATVSAAEAAPAPVVEPEPSLDGVDYDLLAGVLLKKALVALRSSEDGGPKLRAAQEELKRADAQAKFWKDAAEEAKRRVSELETTVRIMEANQQTLQGKLDKPARREGHQVRDLISKQEQAELERMMKSLPSNR